MTLTAANAKKMLFTLRYPPDKILKTFTGSFTATKTTSIFDGFAFAAHRTHEAINHGLGGQAYLQMRYSRDGGTTWQDQFVITPDVSSGFPVFQTLEVSAFCTSTQIIIAASNWTDSDIAIMYEVVAFAKPGVTYSAIPTVTAGINNFVLSSRFNIQKIHPDFDKSVTISIPSASSAVQIQDIVTHSFGYVPFVRLFYEPVPGELWPFSPSQFDNHDGGPGTTLEIFGNPILSTSKLSVRVVNASGSAQDVTFHYRIYLDE